MLARHNGQVVLVWGAIPGERVRARIERTGKGVLFAETTEVVSPSPDRRDAAPDWRCGGNVLAHVSYDRQRELKSEIIRDAFTRIGRMPLDTAPPVIGSPEQGYRMRARLHVRGGRIGFVREGSHDVCAVGPTAQMLPATVAWIDAAERRLRDDKLTGLTSIELAENVPASERACHLELEPGPAPASFAGLATDGLFGLSLAAARAAEATLVEGDPISGHDLEENARPYADHARVIRTSVEDFLHHDKPSATETFIVDPPRTGMSQAAVRALARLQ